MQPGQSIADEATQFLAGYTTAGADAEIIEASDRGHPVDCTDLAAANERLRRACSFEDGDRPGHSRAGRAPRVGAVGSDGQIGFHHPL